MSLLALTEAFAVFVSLSGGDFRLPGPLITAEDCAAELERVQSYEELHYRPDDRGKYFCGRPEWQIDEPNHRRKGDAPIPVEREAAEA